MKSRRPLVVPPEDVQERFWGKVEMTDDCWPWNSTVRASDNVGVFGIDGKILYAHRVAYVIAFGGIPDGKDVRRTCKNPLCVRPLHLCLVPFGARIPDQDSFGEPARYRI